MIWILAAMVVLGCSGWCYSWTLAHRLARLSVAGDAMCSELALCTTGKRFSRKRAHGLYVGWLEASWTAQSKALLSAVQDREIGMYYTPPEIVDPASGTGVMMADAVEGKA